MGTKLDLRDCLETIEQLRERRHAPIATMQGLAMAKEIREYNYQFTDICIIKALKISSSSLIVLYIA